MKVVVVEPGGIRVTESPLDHVTAVAEQAASVEHRIGEFRTHSEVLDDDHRDREGNRLDSGRRTDRDESDSTSKVIRHGAACHDEIVGRGRIQLVDEVGVVVALGVRLLLPASRSHLHDHPKVRMPPRRFREPTQQCEAVGLLRRYLGLRREDDFPVLVSSLGLLGMRCLRKERQGREAESHLDAQARRKGFEFPDLPARMQNEVVDLGAIGESPLGGRDRDTWQPADDHRTHNGGFNNDAHHHLHERSAHRKQHDVRPEPGDMRGEC